MAQSLVIKRNGPSLLKGVFRTLSLTYGVFYNYNNKR